MEKRKKPGPQEILRLLCRDIREETERWVQINNGGGWDPSWPDGVNMNLIRRHIISDRERAAEICVKNGLPLPEESLMPLPPEVSNAFMADPARELIVPCIAGAVTSRKAVYELPAMLHA